MQQPGRIDREPRGLDLFRRSNLRYVPPLDSFLEFPDVTLPVYSDAGGRAFGAAGPDSAPPVPVLPRPVHPSLAAPR